MTHLEEVKAWLAALDHWRGRLDDMNIPKPPRVPPSVQTWLMDQAMALDDEQHEAAILEQYGDAFAELAK